MSSVVKSLQMAVAVMRIGCFQLCRRVCGKAGPPPRPHFALLALGLSGSGKTTMLATLCGEEAPAPAPTNGFAIKAAQLDTVVFDVKELGGSDKFRKFWDKYYDEEVDGVVFLIDLTATPDAMDEAIQVLQDVEAHAELQGIPLIVIGTKRDVDGAKSADELDQLVKEALPDIDKRRLFRTATVSTTDPVSVKAAFNTFAECFDTSTSDE